MKYRCIIVDDEELARRLIKNHLDQLEDFEIVASCASAIEASKILKKETVDLLFLDIEMPVLRGTDFFQNLIQKPKVIFTTAYRDYAVDGFELNAVDYLLKPITFGRFFKAIEKFLAQQQQTNSAIDEIKQPTADKNYVFVRKDRKQVKVFFDDILYIQSVKDYINIITQAENHLTKHSMNAFIAEIDSRFIRVHRSYIINRDKMTAFTKNDIEINQFEIPIGDSYRSKVEELIKK
ncbi:LytR/AlgR family response regulator transcription factor [Spongiivirga citrea]|uniref:Response regulator n=1 Tax=Spongiivirga citrea TaxID=1481457 RepID=A0A6M0CFI5_9FLAO|nr:LytTR family DNA-binding domain-containing protein [Spongiivirga citrea]NER16626.1 response regulator [Spongiivirga citrea]